MIKIFIDWLSTTHDLSHGVGFYFCDVRSPALTTCFVGTTWMTVPCTMPLSFFHRRHFAVWDGYAGAQPFRFSRVRIPIRGLATPVGVLPVACFRLGRWCQKPSTRWGRFTVLNGTCASIVLDVSWLNTWVVPCPACDAHPASPSSWCRFLH